MLSTDETNYPAEVPFSFRLDAPLSCRQQNLREVNLHRLQVFTTYSSEAVWVELWLNLLKKEPSMKLIEMAGFRHILLRKVSALFFTLYQQMLDGTLVVDNDFSKLETTEWSNLKLNKI